MSIRHKCFISYHHDDDDEVDEFIRTFDQERDVFIARGLGQEMADEIIQSDNTDYVMRRIRELYLGDSTVTLVLMGKCTWARRYVDWELQSSLRSGDTVTPNGILGIKLPSYGRTAHFPDRLNKNLLSDADKQAGRDCYARTIEYPIRKDTLANAIDAAFESRRTSSHLIINPRDRFGYNRQC